MHRRHHKAGSKEPPEFDITTFLNLMVVLVPFLLITAVFSRVAILELNMPAAAASTDQNSENKPLEIIVRANELEVDFGSKNMSTIPKNPDTGYNFEELSRVLKTIKDQNPKKEDALILMEPDLDYDYLIQAMDATRSINIKVEGAPEDAQAQTEVLFPSISIGDAYEKGKKK